MKFSLLLSLAAFVAADDGNYYATHNGGSQYVGNQGGDANGNGQGNQQQNNANAQGNQANYDGYQQYNQQQYQQNNQNNQNQQYNNQDVQNQYNEQYYERQEYNRQNGGQYVNGQWVYNYGYNQGAYDNYDPEKYYTGTHEYGEYDDDNEYDEEHPYNGPYQYYGNYGYYNKQDYNGQNFEGGMYYTAYDEDGNPIEYDNELYNGQGHHYYSGYYGNPTQNENPDDYTAYQSKCDGSANSRYCNNQGKDLQLGYVDVNNCANTMIQVTSAQVTCDSPYQYYYGNGAKRNSYLCDHGDQASITVFFKVLKDLPSDTSVYMTMGIYANVAGTYQLAWADKAADAQKYVGHGMTKKGQYAFSTRVQMDDDNNIYNEKGEFIPILEMGFSTKQDKLYNLGGMNIECTWDNTYQPYSPNPWWAGGKGGSFIKASRDTVGSKVAAFFLNLIILLTFLGLIGGAAFLVYKKFGDRLGLNNIEFQGTLDKAADFFRMGDDDDEEDRPGIDHTMTDTSKSLAA
jgi:hypothetical protein